MAGLDGATEEDSPKLELEYTRKFAYPIPKRHLPRPLRSSTAMKSTPYGLADLTIPSWTRLARRVGRKKGKTMRQRFKEFMSMGREQA